MFGVFERQRPSQWYHLLTTSKTEATVTYKKESNTDVLYYRDPRRLGGRSVKFAERSRHGCWIVQVDNTTGMHIEDNARLLFRGKVLQKTTIQEVKEMNGRGGRRLWAYVGRDVFDLSGKFIFRRRLLGVPVVKGCNLGKSSSKVSRDSNLVALTFAIRSPLPIPRTTNPKTFHSSHPSFPAGKLETFHFPIHTPAKLLTSNIFLNKTRRRKATRRPLEDPRSQQHS